MSSPKNVTLGEYIYTNIDSNEYLQEIYRCILINYSAKLFDDATIKKTTFNLDHALRFADVLSKSSDTPNSEKHKTWAQEIVALLNFLYPNNAKVKAFATTILSTIGNYRGLELIKTKYKSSSFLDELYSHFDMDYLSIPYQDNKYFFHSQKAIYNQIDNGSFSYSGPTSMGKSLLMRMFIKEKILNGFNGNFAILVPTKALITEINSNICNDLKEELANNNYKVVTSGNSIFLKQDDLHYIFVLTPERLLYTLISYPDISIDYLFIDEAHKISEEDGRSAFYYKVTDMLSERATKPRIILASPNIPNPNKYLGIIPSSMQESVASLSTTFSPVSQMKYFVDLVKNEISIYNEHKKEFIPILAADLQNDPQAFISTVVANAPSKQSIIYCGGREKTTSMAIAYARNLPVSDEPKLIALSNEIKSEIHDHYYLAELIKRGVAYHVGYLPLYIRTSIEKLYQDKLIHTLFCTSTLIEGVNLPADNLFVLSCRNGDGNMSPVEFKNLLGRVGRIKYNLYGNVFVLRNRNMAEKTVKNLIQNDVPEQELSIEKTLTEETKQLIVSCLKNGSLQFDGLDTSSELYSLVRKTGLMLLRDITRGRKTVISSKFDFLTEEDINIIKSKFIRSEANAPQPDDDINVSLDQHINLRQAIAQGMEYPPITNGFFPHDMVYRFLLQLSRVFKWHIYESETLGHPNRLKWYAVILSQWMEGMGLNQIIKKGIDWKITHNGTVMINRQPVPYIDCPSHQNHVIAETLGIIDNVILFSIANYFLRFSTEYKLQRTNGQPFENDWYEFVEYGSTNDLTIFFQRNGFSRDTADFIRRNKDKYVVKTSTGYKLKKSILKCGKESVMTELSDTRYNVPELFID